MLPFDDGYMEVGTTYVNFDGEENEDLGAICAAIGMVQITCVCALDCGGYEYR